MSMKTQKMKKENNQQSNLNKSTLIKVALITRNIKQRQIAKELGITPQAVNRAINGLSPIKRVDDWCERNLGIAF
ncbi:MAG: helix-turn-helix domain-containing protein [Candidatus Gastranaerophilales bacterium]|nr:helix-turn-helix domain-containing protein [Candidatus Gastranaerophilales bacterium]